MRIILMGIVIAALLTNPLPLFADNPYYDRTHEFSINFPDGWDIKRSANKETIIKAVLKDPQGRLAIISIAAYPLPIALKHARQAQLTSDIMWEGLREQYPDFKMRRLNWADAKVRSTPAVWNIVEIYDPPQAAMFAKHYHLLRGTTLFRITAMTVHDKSFFDTQLSIMDAAISTFSFGL